MSVCRRYERGPIVVERARRCQTDSGITAARGVLYRDQEAWLEKRRVASWGLALSLLLGGGGLECRRAIGPPCDTLDEPGACVPHFQSGADLWAHVEENVGRDV